jgi:glycerate kinase
MRGTQWPDTPFGDKDAFHDFLLANEMAHNAIAYALTGIGRAIVSVPLADAGSDVNEWMVAHQSIHRQELDALGESGQIELTSADFTNEQEYYDWMQMHAMIHAYVESVLGL